MNLDILLLIFVGYFADISDSSGYDGKEVHFKILLPVYKHSHKHTHTVYKKPKGEKTIIIHNHHHKHDHEHEYDDNHGPEHDDNHEHKHNHDHKHEHGHKHKQGHNHKHKDGEHEYTHHYFHDWSTNSDPFKKEKPSKPSAEIKKLKSYGLVPAFVDKKPKTKLNNFVGLDDDGYLRSHKSLKTESFHLTEKKDSAAQGPTKKKYLTGSYKVLEKEPNDFTSNQYHKVFRAPFNNKKVEEYTYEFKNPFSDEKLGFPEHGSLYHKDGDDGDSNSGHYDYLKSAALVDYEIAVLEQQYDHF